MKTKHLTYRHLKCKTRFTRGLEIQSIYDTLSTAYAERSDEYIAYKTVQTLCQKYDVQIYMMCNALTAYQDMNGNTGVVAIIENPDTIWEETLDAIIAGHPDFLYNNLTDKA